LAPKKKNNSYSSKNGFPVIFNARYTNIYGIPELEYPGLVKILYHGGPFSDPDVRDFSDLNPIINHVREYIKNYLQMLDHESPAIIEKCMYTCTPDNFPIMDFHETNKNIIIGTGYSGSGFKHSPASGLILANLALGNHQNSENFLDIQKFKLNRFRLKDSQIHQKVENGSPVISKL